MGSFSMRAGNVVRLLKRLATDRRGNVLMIMGFAMVPLAMAVGVAIDYSKAARLRTHLNAAADAAALAAVTTPMMSKSADEAREVARRMFNAQANGQRDMIFDPAKLTVTINQSSGNKITRTAVVTYEAESRNSFAGLLGPATMVIAGTSTATADKAPDIDFYLMLDTSPSMALPATTAGLQTMLNDTGCAFACHQTDLTDHNETVMHEGSRIDFYTYAKRKGLLLRTDLVHEAVVDLVDVARDVSQQNAAQYRMALSQFDFQYKEIVATPGPPSAIPSKISEAALLVYCKNNHRVCGINDNDTATRTSVAFGTSGVLRTLPNPAGNGTKAAGDSPQAILFIVTDGARDEFRPGGKPEGPFEVAPCELIKNRGVRIAVLYTEYLKESLSARDAGTRNWIDQNFRFRIDPVDTLAPALQSCASPGLYQKVSTNDDISAALAGLFRQAVATARITR